MKPLFVKLKFTYVLTHCPTEVKVYERSILWFQLRKTKHILLALGYTYPMIRGKCNVELLYAI